MFALFVKTPTTLKVMMMVRMVMMWLMMRRRMLMMCSQVKTDTSGET